jgi:zinc/manganese transport system permease protein
MSFAVHALAEVGFTGSAGFLLVGLSPVLGLLTGSMLTALFIGGLGVRIRERDSVVGVIMAFGLGLGVLFITLYPRFAGEAFAILLTGSITTVSRGDLMLLMVMAVVTIAGLGAMYRPLTFATVDPVVAEARGVPVRSVGVALVATLGGILLALVTTAPVSFYVTTIAFACYLAARFGLPLIRNVGTGQRVAA